MITVVISFLLYLMYCILVKYINTNIHCNL